MSLLYLNCVDVARANSVLLLAVKHIDKSPTIMHQNWKLQEQLLLVNFSEVNAGHLCSLAKVSCFNEVLICGRKSLRYMDWTSLVALKVGFHFYTISTCCYVLPGSQVYLLAANVSELWTITGEAFTYLYD